MLLKTIILIVLLTLVNAQIWRRPIVTIDGGQISGTRHSSSLFNSFFAFRGIPYALPPVGNLRFRNPQPPQSWKGVRDGSKHASHCPNDDIIGREARGNEDCLYLNVYTTSLTGSRAVMFWIHGGAYVIGDGDSSVYGPDFIVRDDVVVVTINYRLSALGFLSTEDENAQGNYGLKDMVAALKWVKLNIHNFGGDPELVTIFGQSAGGSSVHYLMLSKMSENLFKRAISQSGSALSPFAFQSNPRAKAEELGRKLNLKFNSTADLVNQLRNVSFQSLKAAENGLFSMDQPLGLRGFDFVPSLEPEDSIEERFLADTPIDLMRNGEFHQVPFIMGFTNNEGLMMIRQTEIDNQVFERFNENDSNYVPMSYNLESNSSDNSEVATAFRELYFDGENASADNMPGWARYNTDHQFQFPIDRTIKYFVANQSHPIYYYTFEIEGSFNILKRILFLQRYEGACHADDIFYLFTPVIPIPVWPLDHALTLRRRLIRMWTHFAKTGNPTPYTDSLVNTVWPEYTKEGENYMAIGGDLKVKRMPKNGPLKVWHDFQQRFTGHQ